jgi:EAL domain-containing protein (putative c-di-GMP-specific phosphodiesterase class I)
MNVDLFMLRYQPIGQILTGKVLYHEMLIRMQGYNGKTIAPEAVLPAAVRFGLMAEIDTWLVEYAIAAVAKHQKKRPELRFAFNLSANAFERSDQLDLFDFALR